jgi:hypothetical protein
MAPVMSQASPSPVFWQVSLVGVLVQIPGERGKAVSIKKGLVTLAVCILQGNKFPALALAVALVSPAFENWHSISEPTAHPHSHWKVGPGEVSGGEAVVGRIPRASFGRPTPLLCPSLPGKLFRCSALSCSEIFPSMQELVAHGKLHYKPNRYFK